MTTTTVDEDTLLSLAFSLRANPRAYAVLLGAGVSAPSGILTAWGVVTDLISRVSVLVGEDEPADPAAWYEARFGEEARYENLLEKLAPSQLERQRLLREYFEPADPDDESEARKPTLAHRSIAKLVKAGSLRVLVTLNFDRLLEQAIREEGIEPTIVASAGDVAGLAPLHTLECCIVHLHGDYLNPSSMLNTTAELDVYEPEMLELLRCILRDYGLIIAGWSATYDPALVSAIKANYPSRYTMMWVEPGFQSTLAAEFRQLMNGHLVPLDADTAFGRIADSLVALTNRAARHPLAASAAAETAKRELSGRWVAIRLHDTLSREFDRLRRVPELNLGDNPTEAEDGYLAMVGRIEEACRVPAALVATLAYWGGDDTDGWWIEELDRFSHQQRASGLVKLLRMNHIAGSILFYAAGIAAVASRRYPLLRRLLLREVPSGQRDEDELLARIFGTDRALENASPRLYQFLRPVLSEALSISSEALEDAWQQFEVLRNAKIVMANKNFPDAWEALSDAESDLDIEHRMGADGPSSDNLGAVQAKTLRARDERLQWIGRLGDLWNVHLYAVDRRLNERWHIPVAQRLVKELYAQGDAHPLVRAGLGPNSQQLAGAIRGVSKCAGDIANELTWKRLNVGGNRVGAGFLPDELWIDTGMTAQEHAEHHEAGLP